MMHMWGCTLCPSRAETPIDAFADDPFPWSEGTLPDGWHSIDGRPLCPAHQHDDPETVDLVMHWPNQWKLSGAGGMWWLTEVDHKPVLHVTAYRSPYEAVAAWVKESRQA
jgi:hypothetical protein